MWTWWGERHRSAEGKCGSAEDKCRRAEENGGRSAVKEGAAQDAEVSSSSGCCGHPGPCPWGRYERLALNMAAMGLCHALLCRHGAGCGCWGCGCVGGTRQPGCAAKQDVVPPPAPRGCSPPPVRGPGGSYSCQWCPSGLQGLWMMGTLCCCGGSWPRCTHTPHSPMAAPTRCPLGTVLRDRELLCL